jgi:hypothetical protein
MDNRGRLPQEIAGERRRSALGEGCMRSALSRVGGIGLFTAIVGCVGNVEPSLDSDATTTAASESALLAERFVTLKADTRRCAAPLCGGYFVRDVNANTPEEYVSRLDFEESRLDRETIQRILEEPLSDLVLKGHLGPIEPTSQTRTFIVLAAYRSLPGMTPQSPGMFYYVQKRVPRIECFTTPCPRKFAVEVNTEERYDIDTVSFEALPPFVDRSWLTVRLERGQALAMGRLSLAPPVPREQNLLVADQVFLRLPERAGPCPWQQTQSCGDRVATFRRTVDRCVVFDRCVDRGVCSDAAPVCADGYKLSSWPAAPSGCAAFACDPAFATP